MVESGFSHFASLLIRWVCEKAHLQTGVSFESDLTISTSLTLYLYEGLQAFESQALDMEFLKQEWREELACKSYFDYLEVTDFVAALNDLSEGHFPKIEKAFYDVLQECVVVA